MLVREEETPNLLTHEEMKAATQLAIEVSLRCAASSHLVERLIMVRMWFDPSGAAGSGPTSSMWTWLNLLAGTGMGCTGAAGWVVTFPRWHCWHSLHHGRCQPPLTAK